MSGSTILLRERRGVGVTTPLFTRHMLGVIELEREERRRRRAAIRDGESTYEPVARVVEPAIAAVAPALTLSAFDVDRWVDEGGSYQGNGGRFHRRLDGGELALSADGFGTAEETRRAAADVQGSRAGRRSHESIVSQRRRAIPQGEPAVRHD